MKYYNNYSGTYVQCIQGLCQSMLCKADYAERGRERDGGVRYSRK